MALGPHPEFSWSASRNRAFEYCRRQYWFQYYGHWLGWEDRGPARTKEIYRLKQLQSLPTWAGSAVHQGVALMFHDRPVEQVVDELHQQMRREYVNSYKRIFQQRGKAKTFGLDLHEYDIEVPRERFKEMWDGVRASLESFPDLPYLSNYREARAAGRFHLAESPGGGDFESRRFRWEEVGDFPIYAIPDASYERADGVVEVLDWKTGREPTSRSPSEATLQLVLYARMLQARHPRRPGIHHFEVAEVYLPRGVRYGRRLAEDDIQRAEQAVSDSAATMRDLLDDPRQNVASEDRFDMIEALQKCRRCVFRRVCPRGDELAADGS